MMVDMLFLLRRDTLNVSLIRYNGVRSQTTSFAIWNFALEVPVLVFIPVLGRRFIRLIVRFDTSLCIGLRGFLLP